jgi:arginine decarboxylase
MQEFANDIIYTINEICQSENVPPPTIVRSGRALAAHHALIIITSGPESRAGRI